MRFIDNPFQCPVTRTMSIIGGKWKPIILNCIGDKTIRFGKLNQLMPAISNKVLSKELKDLESLGLIKRLESNDLPQRVEYNLTDAGISLMPVLVEVANWGNSHFAKQIESKLQKKSQKYFFLEIEALYLCKIIAGNKIGYVGWGKADGEISFWYKSGTNEKAAITFVITA